jgi:hypothetical protein
MIAMTPTLVYQKGSLSTDMFSGLESLPFRDGSITTFENKCAFNILFFKLDLTITSF